MTWRSSRGACPEYLPRALSRGSRGETEIFVLVIVILGAFLLAGGQLLFQSNTDSGLSQPSAGGNSSVPTPTPAAGTATDYIKVLSNGCDNTNHQGNSSIGVTAPLAGYISFGLKVAGSPQFTKSYTPPSQSIGLTLSNSDGFNTKPWQIQLFSGGTQSGIAWSGGTLVTTKDMDPTGCQ